MTRQWMIRLARADAVAVNALRLVPGLEVAEDDGDIWLRGNSAVEEFEHTLQALPALERFEWLPPDRLRPIYSRLPTVLLPSLTWQPIGKWSQVALPTAALMVQEPIAVSLCLERSAEEKPANVLLTDFKEWMAFALQAAEIRLGRLKFAVSSQREVVIWGTPLPPIPGQPFVEVAGIAVRAGFCWRPAVSPQVLRQVFQAGEEALVLWRGDGSVSRLHPEQLLPASRRAVRATAMALENDE